MRKTAFISVVLGTTILSGVVAAANYRGPQLRGYQPVQTVQFAAPAPVYRPAPQPAQLRGAYPASVYRPVPLPPQTVYGANAYNPSPYVGFGGPAYGSGVRPRPKHNNLLKVGVAQFNFDAVSDDLKGAGGPDNALNAILTPAGLKVDVKNATTVGGSYTRHIGDHFGIEVPLAPPVTIKLTGAGTLANTTPNVGSVKAVPATVLANLYLTPRDATFRPYVGAAVNHTIFYDAEPDASLSDVVLGNPEIEIDNSTGLGVFAGLNGRLSDRAHASILAGVVDVKAKADIRTDTLPDLLGGQLIIDREIEVDLNPVVGLATVGFSF